MPPIPYGPPKPPARPKPRKMTPKAKSPFAPMGKQYLVRARQSASAARAKAGL